MCRLAIGVGFRKACSAETLVALVENARRLAAMHHPALADLPATLVTIAEKDRPVLHQAAAHLGLPVLILPKQALAEAEDRIAVRSATAKACFGIPSVAEAAALAAGGPGARLVLTRISVADATCAIAAVTQCEGP